MVPVVTRLSLPTKLTSEPGMVAYTFNPSNWGTEAGRSLFQASLFNIASYMPAISKNINKTVTASTSFLKSLNKQTNKYE